LSALANAGGNGAPPTPGRILRSDGSNYHGRLDLSGRRLRTDVQRIVDWWLAQDTFSPIGQEYTYVSGEVGSLRATIVLFIFPLTGRYNLSEMIAPYFYDWLAHPNYDELLEALVRSRALLRILMSRIECGGWYDVFQGGSCENYLGLKANTAGRLPGLISG